MADTTESVKEKTDEKFDIFTQTPQTPGALSVVSPEKEEISAGMINESDLNAQERQIVEEYMEKINISDVNNVISFGSEAQQNISDFSVSVLDTVRTNDLGSVGSSLKDLATALDTIDMPSGKGIFKVLRKGEKKLLSLRNKYSSAESNVSRIESELRKHQEVLNSDIEMFQHMYDMNIDHYKQLSLYIIAGKEVIEKEKNGRLLELKSQAEKTQLPEDVTAYNDYKDMISRFEKKVSDLEITRMIAIQTAPQIRMLQNNNRELSEKIQSSLVNTIPLWRNQLVLSLGYEHSREALTAQSAITDKTNELLKKNSEMLKTNSIKTAKESERSIVDIETLKVCNNNLISSINEVVKVHDEGTRKRTQAHDQLLKLETDLKNTLLENSRKN